MVSRTPSCILIALPGAAIVSSAQTADLILLNGKILTVNAKDSVAQAVAAAHGKIIAICYGIWSSTVRTTLKGVYVAQPFGTPEAIDVHPALRPYTNWAARRLFLEDKIGSIEPGRDTDIAVWDRDLYTMPTDEIRNLKCELTLLGGKVVYER